MNDSQSFYLETYFKFYFMDHLIKNYIVFYLSWKYWHSPMLHTKSLAMVVEYDIYKECAECGLDSVWEIVHTIYFWKFGDVLYKKMLQYSPTW